MNKFRKNVTFREWHERNPKRLVAIKATDIKQKKQKTLHFHFTLR